jgi:hypothetical protein
MEACASERGYNGGMLRAVPPLLLALLPWVHSAGMLLELPQTEPEGSWEPVAQELGLELGEAVHPPWARLVPQPGGGCELEVASTWGELQRESVPCPTDTGGREEVASLAVVMLSQLVAADRPMGEPPAPTPQLLATAPVAAEQPAAIDPAQAAPAPRRPPPPRFELMGRDGSAIHGRAESMTASPPSQLGSEPAVLSEAVQGTDPTPHARKVGTSQFNPLCFYTDCAVSFDRRSCGARDGCSTAEKCPDTYWLDFDRDGYGSPQTCLSLATERGVGAWVQNVGDCDDRHSSIHPGAEEVIGDDIDNDCDGVAR